MLKARQTPSSTSSCSCEVAKRLPLVIAILPALSQGLTGLQVSDFRGGLGQAAATLASYQALSQEEQLALWETYYQQNNSDQTLDGNGERLTSAVVLACCFLECLWEGSGA